MALIAYCEMVNSRSALYTPNYYFQSILNAAVNSGRGWLLFDGNCLLIQVFFFSHKILLGP